jgi:serine phosphatase RsbU (regulator of sigma subunit)
MLVAQSAFALFGIVAPIFGVPRGILISINSAMVLGTVLIAVAYLAVTRLRSGSRPPLSRDVRIFAAGFAVWLLFVIYVNLGSLGFLPVIQIEFVGFLIFVACLAYVSATRTLANEEKLVEINNELKIAHGIQTSILPRSIPKLPRLDIAARYAPMSAVAGDFYDFLEVDAQHLGILVADVTGHGVPAALIASMLKIAFAAQAPHAADPAAVLSGLNRALCGKFDEHFVTAAYLFLDLQAGLLRYAAAGHPPMLSLPRQAVAAQEISENGLMLGLFPEAEYSGIERKINAGDRFLLYTDGVFEARNAAQEEYGRARCRQALVALRSLPAEAVTAALFDEVAEFSGLTNKNRPQEDDITLVVVDIR